MRVQNILRGLNEASPHASVTTWTWNEKVIPCQKCNRGYFEFRNCIVEKLGQQVTGKDRYAFGVGKSIALSVHDFTGAEALTLKDMSDR